MDRLHNLLLFYFFSEKDSVVISQKTPFFSKKAELLIEKSLFLLKYVKEIFLKPIIIL